MALDPVARAELEQIARDWRDVHLAGGTYTVDALKVLDAQKDAGRIDSSQAIEAFMSISRFATHATDKLTLPSPLLPPLLALIMELIAVREDARGWAGEVWCRGRKVHDQRSAGAASVWRVPTTIGVGI